VKILGEWTVPQLQLYAATITCVTCQAISLHQFMSEDRDRMLSKIAQMRKLPNTYLIDQLICSLLNLSIARLKWIIYRTCWMVMIYTLV